ncbi:MAG TPA: sugar MFS transporter [Terriglobales bacterium]|nr:sugar MFS transporter [Terriglobales bacterium]
MPIANVGTAAPTVEKGPAKYNLALIVVTSLFFMWGFVTVLNDVLVPHLKSIFDLNYFQSMLIQFSFFSAYFIFSIPSSRMIDWIGYKWSMVVGIVVLGIGAFLFIPAASVPSYPLFLAAFMVLAAGITLLQVAANPYVAVLGPPETASARLNLSQAFNSLGTTIGPALGGALILNAAPKSMEAVRQMSESARRAYQIEVASSVKMPYLAIGLALMALAVVIGLFKLPPMPQAERHGEKKGEKHSVWKYRHLVLGAVAIFVYVGAEVSIGSFLINYLSQSYIGNISQLEAARYVSYYWGGAMIGRFIGSALLHGVRTIHMAICAVISGALLGLSYMESAFQGIPFFEHAFRWLVQGRPLVALCTAIFVVLLLASLVKGGRVAMKTGHLLGLCATCTTVLVITSMSTTGPVAMWSIILVGLFNSIMFPSIFTLGIAELGPLTGDGSGLLIMAIVGGALIPVAQGAVADRIGIHHAFFLPAICYCYIVYYALKGSKPTELA